MLIPDVRLVRDRYESQEYLHYPEMQKMLADVMENPAAQIELPSDFLTKKNEHSSLLGSVIGAIKDLCKKALIHFRCAVNPDYSLKRNRAIAQIENAYSQKVSDISQLARVIMCNKEPIQKNKEMVLELKGRIKKLREDMEKDKSSLEEMIDAKNLIVKDAKILAGKQKNEPGFWKSMWHRLAKIIPRAGSKGPDLTLEIKENDASFPLENVTDDLIEAYEKEEYNESTLITNIKLKKKTIEQEEALLAKEEALLQAALSLLTKASEEIKKAAKEVERLQLEDYFSDEDLELPDVAVESAESTPAKELTAKELALQLISSDVAAKTGVKELSTLFKTLIGRLPEDAITSWTCDASGNFTLKLKECFPVWMPEVSPKGGAVLMLGYKTDGEISGRLTKNTIEFNKGVNSFVKVFPLGFIYPSFDSIEFINKIDIAMSGSYLGQKEAKHKTFSQIKKDWESNGVVIDSSHPGGYKGFLEGKIAAA